MEVLLKKYREEILPKLAEEFGRQNIHSLPKIEKICLNMGVGDAIQDSKILDACVQNMTTICGQKAVKTLAKKSVSNFKLRLGYLVGCRVTLRGRIMWEFLNRLINAAIPRIRDFRGVNEKSFDKAGNYSLGIEELSIFPEIDPDKPEVTRGMDITIVISNSSGAAESRSLLAHLGMPFRRAQSGAVA